MDHGICQIHSQRMVELLKTHLGLFRIAITIVQPRTPTPKHQQHVTIHVCVCVYIQLFIYFYNYLNLQFLKEIKVYI